MRRWITCGIGLDFESLFLQSSEFRDNSFQAIFFHDWSFVVQSLSTLTFCSNTYDDSY